MSAALNSIQWENQKESRQPCAPTEDETDSTYIDGITTLRVLKINQRLKAVKNSLRKVYFSFSKLRHYTSQDIQLLSSNTVTQ